MQRQEWYEIHIFFSVCGQGLYDGSAPAGAEFLNGSEAKAAAAAAHLVGIGETGFEGVMVTSGNDSHGKLENGP